jgi:type VI protein secretion system component Hcp
MPTSFHDAQTLAQEASMARALVFLMVTFVAIGLLTFEAWAGKKKVDTASPNFFRSTVKGEHYKEVTIQMRKAGGDPQLSGKAVGTGRKAH